MVAHQAVLSLTSTIYLSFYFTHTNLYHLLPSCLSPTLFVVIYQPIGHTLSNLVCYLSLFATCTYVSMSTIFPILSNSPLTVHQTNKQKTKQNAPIKYIIQVDKIIPTSQLCYSMPMHRSVPKCQLELCMFVTGLFNVLLSPLIWYAGVFDFTIKLIFRHKWMV